MFRQVIRQQIPVSTYNRTCPRVVDRPTVDGPALAAVGGGIPADRVQELG